MIMTRMNCQKKYYDYKDVTKFILEYTSDEEQFIKASLHVKEAASMRYMADTVIAEAKKCTFEQVIPAMMCIALVVDFMMNMDMPYFGGDQPGKTY